MALVHTNRAYAPSHGTVAKFIANSLGAVAAWNDARVTRKALSHLSDHELEDIGLSRRDIDTVAARCAHR